MYDEEYTQPESVHFYSDHNHNNNNTLHFQVIHRILVCSLLINKISFFTINIFIVSINFVIAVCRQQLIHSPAKHYIHTILVGFIYIIQVRCHGAINGFTLKIKSIGCSCFFVQTISTHFVLVFKIPKNETCYRPKA